jgi:hypothetical protein
LQISATDLFHSLILRSRGSKREKPEVESNPENWPVNLWRVPQARNSCIKALREGRHLMYPLKILQKNLVIKMQKNTKIEDPLFSHNQP